MVCCTSNGYSFPFTYSIFNIWHLSFQQCDIPKSSCSRLSLPVWFFHFISSPCPCTAGPYISLFLKIALSFFHRIGFVLITSSSPPQLPLCEWANTGSPFVVKCVRIRVEKSQLEPERINTNRNFDTYFIRNVWSSDWSFPDLIVTAQPLELNHSAAMYLSPKNINTHTQHNMDQVVAAQMVFGLSISCSFTSSTLFCPLLPPGVKDHSDWVPFSR